MAAMPLDADRVAARYGQRFRAAHLASNRPLVIGYLLVLVLSDILLLRGGILERVCWALVQSSMFYLVLAYSSHRRFQPWCPQCRGGEEFLASVAPQPLPSGGRPG
jgi:hypothetical protein